MSALPSTTEGDTTGTSPARVEEQTVPETSSIEHNNSLQHSQDSASASLRENETTRSLGERTEDPVLEHAKVDVSAETLAVAPSSAAAVEQDAEVHGGEQNNSVTSKSEAAQTQTGVASLREQEEHPASHNGEAEGKAVDTSPLPVAASTKTGDDGRPQSPESLAEEVRETAGTLLPKNPDALGDTNVADTPSTLEQQNTTSSDEENKSDETHVSLVAAAEAEKPASGSTTEQSTLSSLAQQKQGDMNEEDCILKSDVVARLGDTMENDDPIAKPKVDKHTDSAQDSERTAEEQAAKVIDTLGSASAKPISPTSVATDVVHGDEVQMESGDVVSAVARTTPVSMKAEEEDRMHTAHVEAPKIEGTAHVSFQLPNDVASAGKNQTNTPATLNDDVTTTFQRKTSSEDNSTKALEEAQDIDRSARADSSIEDDGRLNTAGDAKRFPEEEEEQQQQQRLQEVVPLSKPAIVARKRRRAPLAGAARSQVYSVIVKEEVEATAARAQPTAAPVHSDAVVEAQKSRDEGGHPRLEADETHEPLHEVSAKKAKVEAGEGATSNVDSTLPLPTAASAPTTVAATTSSANSTIAERAAMAHSLHRDSSSIQTKSNAASVSSQKPTAPPDSTTTSDESPAQATHSKSAHAEVPAVSASTSPTPSATSTAAPSSPSAVLSQTPLPPSSAAAAAPTATTTATTSTFTKPVLNIAGVNVQGLLAESSDPPPLYFRRQRRTRRKSILGPDHPLFAEHRDLWQHDQAHRVIARAPFASDADVLSSVVEWRDSPSLVYARLLWRYTPQPFLRAAMEGLAPVLTHVKPEPKPSSAEEAVVVKKEEADEMEE